MRFLVTGTITISVHTIVEAKNVEEAKGFALERPVQGLCHQCASAEGNDEWVTSGELDGEVNEIRAERV